MLPVLYPSREFIPVVAQYTSGSSLGTIKAVAGLRTNQGVVQGRDPNGLIICAGSGIGNLSSGVYYGFELEATLADATAQGWPGNSTDIQWPSHNSVDYVYIQ